MDNIYHHGDTRKEEDFIYIRPSRRSEIIKVEMNENTIPDDFNKALGYILKYSGLMRVTRYKTYKKNIFKYSFHSVISFGNPIFYPLKNKDEVIYFACYLKCLDMLKERDKSKIYRLFHHLDFSKQNYYISSTITEYIKHYTHSSFLSSNFLNFLKIDFKSR